MRDRPSLVTIKRSHPQMNISIFEQSVSQQNINQLPPQPYALGISTFARDRLAELSGAPPQISYLITDDKKAWRASRTLSTCERAMYITTTWSVECASGDWMHLADG